MKKYRIRIWAIIMLLSIMLSSVVLGIPAKANGDNTGNESIEIPSKFDLRELGMVTPVRNIGNYPLCWAFAFIASIESNALMKGYGMLDLSEYHASYLASYNSVNAPKEIEGEGIKTNGAWYSIFASPEYIADAYMQGYAIQSEDDFPYGVSTCLNGDIHRTDGPLYVDSCYSVPITDIDTVKKLIMQNGAAAISISYSAFEIIYYSRRANLYVPMVGYNLYDPQHGNFFDAPLDHYVVIVGWDDSYSRDEFETKPPADGAWIVKNCFGRAYGDDGYDYISYYDGAFRETGNLVLSFITNNEKSFDRVYQYDGSRGCLSVSDTEGVAMDIKASDHERLNAVRIWVRPDEGEKTFSGCNATVSVYNNSDEGNELIYQQKFDITYGGYQTLKFAEAVRLVKNDKYRIEVTFDRPVNYAFDGNFTDYDEEGDYVRYEFVSLPSPFETYVLRASEGDWVDAYDTIIDDSRCTACIKALSLKMTPSEYLPIRAITITAWSLFAIIILSLCIFVIKNVKSRYE